MDAKKISSEANVTLRFSLKILGKLVAGGVVKSFKGTQGGYELAREPEQALHADCEKVNRPGTAMGQAALAEGGPLETLARGELLAGWNAQKRVVPGGEQ